ncbi:unnamed protein product [Rhizophagus irregularis]|nr:unnamed protein product [Rhizophagus irregularis]
MSVAVGFMLPAILAGILFFIQIPILKVPGATIIKLMDASMTRGLWSTLTVYFNSGRTYKLTIIVVSVLTWQYITSAVDLYVHITATGNFQRLPATNGGLLNPARALKTYQNKSKTLQVWYADGEIYLLQSSPPQQAYSYSGSGIFLQPSCKPISKICNLEASYSARTGYTCPETLWSTSENTQAFGLNDVGVNVTTFTYDLAKDKYTSSNLMHAIVSARYPRGGLMNYDSEFINEVHGDLSILLHCQILSSLIEYVITLGTIKATTFGNLTNPQLVALVGASTPTITSFTSAVQKNEENEGGYNYVLEVNKDQTVVPLPVVLLYAIVIIFPPLIYSCICLYSFKNWSDNININWILAEFICIPQRLLYQTLIGEHYVDDACLKSFPIKKFLLNIYLKYI